MNNNSVAITPITVYIIIFVFAAVAYFFIKFWSKRPDDKNTLNKQAFYKLLLSAFSGLAIGAAVCAMVTSTSITSMKLFVSYTGGIGTAMAIFSFFFTRMQIQTMLKQAKNADLIAYATKEEKNLSPFSIFSALISLVGVAGIGIIGYYYANSIFLVLIFLFVGLLMCALIIAENIHSLNEIDKYNKEYQSVIDEYINDDSIPVCSYQDIERMIQEMEDNEE